MPKWPCQAAVLWLAPCLWPHASELSLFPPKFSPYYILCHEHFTRLGPDTTPPSSLLPTLRPDSLSSFLTVPELLPSPPALQSDFLGSLPLNRLAMAHTTS